MAFEAFLKVDGGSELRLIECHYSLQRQTDFMGRPAEEVRGGSLQFSLETSKDNSFAQWVVEPYATKKVEVDFKDPSSGSKLKTVTLTDAYLVSFSESFHAADSQPMVQTMVLSSKEIAIGDAKHANKWPEN